MNKLLFIILIPSILYACDSKETDAAYTILNLLNPLLVTMNRAPYAGDYHPYGTQWHAIYAPLDGKEPASIEFYVQQSHDPRLPQWVYVGCNGLYDRIKKPYTPVTEDQAKELETMLSHYPDAIQDCLKSLSISSLKDFPQSRFILVKNWYEKYHKNPLNLQEMKKEIN